MLVDAQDESAAAKDSSKRGRSLKRQSSLDEFGVVLPENRDGALQRADGLEHVLLLRVEFGKLLRAPGHPKPVQAKNGFPGETNDQNSLCSI